MQNFYLFLHFQWLLRHSWVWSPSGSGEWWPGGGQKIHQRWSQHRRERLLWKDAPSLGRYGHQHIVLSTSQQKSLFMTRPTAILGLETRLFLTPHPISKQKVLGCFSFQNNQIRLRIIMVWMAMIIPPVLGSRTCILKLVNKTKKLLADHIWLPG